jgi:hypothetical protein
LAAADLRGPPESSPKPVGPLPHCPQRSSNIYCFTWACSQVKGLGHGCHLCWRRARKSAARCTPASPAGVWKRTHIYEAQTVYQASCLPFYALITLSVSSQIQLVLTAGYLHAFFFLLLSPACMFQHQLSFSWKAFPALVQAVTPPCSILFITLILSSVTHFSSSKHLICSLIIYFPSLGCKCLESRDFFSLMYHMTVCPRHRTMPGTQYVLSKYLLQFRD